MRVRFLLGVKGMAEWFKAPALKAGGLYYMVSQVQILFLLGGVKMSRWLNGKAAV